ncbi:MAG TPA: exodeoxyribonuclease III [Polyangiaceae bacterium]|jgi:exodeoxyribonuclease-3|nr:exodeoxyribonuclease III [Polyangiaceae bacterium]
MLKLTTWNVNGVRAREAEVLTWLERERPDVLCLQEVKAAPEQLPASLAVLPGYHCYWHGQKGYSGVALHLSEATFPRRPKYAHPSFDHESRIVTARVGDVMFASVYLPNGGKDFPAKVRFLDAIGLWAEEAAREGIALVVSGDLNVAREPRDVHPTLRKPEQLGQTPAERAQLEHLIAQGLVDLSRKFHPDDDQLFSWWAPWRNLREKNVGWRLDYVLAHASLAEHATSCEVVRDFGTSDHGPVTAIFDMPPPVSRDDDEAELAPPPPGPRQQSLF